MERPNRKGRPNRKLVENSISITEEDFEEVGESQPAPKKISKESRLASAKKTQIDPRKCYNPEILELSKKCGRILDKVKSQKSANFFFQTNGNPNLTNVEKQLYAFHYSSLPHFLSDIRRVWKHHFMLMKSPELYQKALEACQHFEEVVYAEELPLTEKTPKAVIKEPEKIKEPQPKVKKDSNTNKVVGQTAILKQQANEHKPPTSIFEMPMSMNEKNQLGDNIRKLTQQQMKGMLNIVKTHSSTESNSKYFEFDIDTLPTKILRELEIYVRDCNSANKPAIAQPALPKARQVVQDSNSKPAKIKKARTPKPKEEGQPKQIFHPRPIKSNTNGKHVAKDQKINQAESLIKMRSAEEGSL